MANARAWHTQDIAHVAASGSGPRIAVAGYSEQLASGAATEHAGQLEPFSQNSVPASSSSLSSKKPGNWASAECLRERNVPADERLKNQVREWMMQQAQLVQQLTDQHKDMSARVSQIHGLIARQEADAERHLDGDAPQDQRHQSILEALHPLQSVSDAKKPVISEAADQPSAERVQPSKTFDVVEAGVESIAPSDLMMRSPTIPTKQETEIHCVRRFLGVMVEHKFFEFTCACVIVCNAVTIGISAEMQIKDAMDNIGKEKKLTIETIENLDLFYFFFYVVELLLKLIAWQRTYFTKPGCKWNIFDFVLVVTAVYNLLMTEGPKGMTWLRVLRLLKMLKMLRVIRLMRFFKKLRTMLNSIMGSMMTLVWSILMLSLIMYIFGLCFTQAVTGFLNDTPRDQITDETMENIKLYWGSIYLGVVTLYMAVTGGADWEPLAQPLRATHEIYHVFFMFYIAFLFLAVLNVLTGLFVDTALKETESDEAGVCMEIFEAQSEGIQDFRDFCERLCNNGSGTITEADIVGSKDAPEIQNFFSALELTIDDARKIFKMLDSSSSGRVGVEEFVTGLSKMRGAQRGLEVVNLIYDQKKLMAQFSVLMTYVEDRFNIIHDQFQHLGVSTKQRRVQCLRKQLAQKRCLPSDWKTS